MNEIEKEKAEEIILKQIIGRHIRSNRLRLNLTQDVVGESVRSSGKHIGRLERGEKSANSFLLTNLQINLGFGSEDYVEEYLTAISALESEE